MKLKFKKILLLCTVFIYFASFFIQSNLVFFQVWAKGVNIPRVNIVPILVDSKIYGGISNGLRGYADYIRQKLSDTKVLIIPLDLENIHAYDIYRMMENIYFDGLKGVNSSLIGVILVGDIPLPVVNQNGYIFPTVYPYVDFENQKYIWDPVSQYFVSNNNPMGQAEIWHGLINYGDVTDLYLEYFEKVLKYSGNPDDFIGDRIWYDDFIAQKKGFVDENFQYYKNRIMFGEDLGYLRHSPLMSDIFKGNSNGGVEDMVDEINEFAKDEYGADVYDGNDGLHNTKMVKQRIETSLTSDYSDLFSSEDLTTMRENVFVGGRWIREYTDTSGEKLMMSDSDGSISKLQMKDDLLLGNENVKGLIENLNELMERMIDQKIEDEHIGMDMVVPISYEETTRKRVDFRCFSFVDRFENYYFGNNARLIDLPQDLSIYRGTYRNLLNLDGVTFDSLLEGKNPAKSEYEKTDLRLKSIGGTYDIFSSQAEANRGYNMLGVERDLDIYDEEKTTAESESHRAITRKVKRIVWPKLCDDKDEDKVCETLYDFAKRWWGGASPININNGAFSWGRYELNDYLATDAWRRIFGMDGFQTLKVGEDEGMDGTGWKNGLGEGPQWAATSFEAYRKYSSPTQKMGWNGGFSLIGPAVGSVYEIYENHTPTVHIPFSKVNYWQLPKPVMETYTFYRDKNSDKVFYVEDDQRSKILPCEGKRIQYGYRVISSVVKHDSTTEDQINGVDRDKYGETGTLGMYYRDIKNAFEAIQSDMNEIKGDLVTLVALVNSGNEYMQTKLKDLNAEVEVFSRLNQEVLELNSELENLQYELDGTDDEDEQNRILSEIGDLQSRIDDVSTEKENSQNTIDTILSDVAELIREENDQLASIYKLMMSLYMDNVISEMEFIIYLEGGEPEAYYEGGEGGVMNVKIGFLPSWMTKVGGMKDDISSGIKDIVKDYADVYSLLEQQQRDWDALASKLKDEGGDSDKVNEVSDEMNNIFTITADEGESTDTITLTGGAAQEVMQMLEKDYKKVDYMYSNLVEEDRTGLQIIAAAKSDKDFRLWLVKHSIDSGKFSEEDWISQYAQWAKGPGYESPGAIKNHELLVGVSEHFSGMNILTADRPIDSPRYTVMQSVAGNEMKFIYPDLFKVEVYLLSGTDKDGNDIHELLTGGQIKKNLIKYLTGKVEEYNDIIEKECQNAKPMDIYYQKLQKLEYIYATPIKGLHSCSRPFTYDEFLEAIGGEEMLDAISETLRYQSLTNIKKSSTGEIEKDIQLIRKSFSLNFKRKQLLEDYLIQGNEKIKNPILEIPMYELSGYEVAYINSDGMDHIFPPIDHADSVRNEKFGSELLNLDEHPVTIQESELADECGVPPSGTLPIFGGSPTWLEGFKCWLRKTLNEPLNVKLKFDASLGELLYADTLEGDIKDSEDTRDFTKWGDASEYADHWDTLLQLGTGFDSDKMITQLQVKAQQHNQNVISGNEIVANIYREVKIDNGNLLLSDSNPNSELKIESAKDVGPITVTFKGTGDGCIKIDLNELCTGQSFTTKPFNPKFNPFTGLVSTADNVAGKDGLIIQINVGGKYIENIIKYTVSPSVLQNFDIIIDDKKTVAGMVSPVTVVGYDKNNNEVERGLEKYKFTVTTGRFLKDGAYQESFETNDLKNLKFYYQAPLDAVDGSEAIIQISRSNNPEEIIYSTGQKLIQANPIITLNGGTPILKGRDVLSVNQIYRLSSDETIYNGNDLDVSKLQRLDIEMRDDRGELIDLDSQILVTSQNRLVTLGQVQTLENGKNNFFETSKVYMTGGHVVIYYYPTKVAGEEIINIDIPGLATRVINLTINPADSEKDPIIFQVKIPNNYVKLYDTTDFELFASDVWGNPVTRGFKVIFNPQKVDFPLLECYQCQDPESWVKMGDIKDGYLKTKVEGKGEGLEDIFVTNYGSIYVDVGRNLLPETGLNIMYLNYFGNDWGNQWGYFSDNDNYVEKLMSQSEKLLTTTTQLVSEDKIKKILWKIEPEFWIENYDGVDTVMNMQSNGMYMIVGSFSEMHAPMPSFTWMQVTTDSIETILNNKTSAAKNYAFFIPSDPNYKIVSGALYHSGIFLANLLDGELTFHLSDKTLYGHNVWDVVDRGINCGRLIIHYPSFKPSVQNFEEPGAGYIVGSVFSNGSSDNLSSVGIFDELSDFKLDTRYKSIQNSDEIEEKVGFQGDFKNITLFAEGEIVGEATRKYGSELLINLGDPVLTRKGQSMNVYGTNFDGGVGQEVLADYEDDILGVYRIDFNGDNLKDWLIVYLDGRLKLLKNYGGNPDLRDMQDLMRVAVHIQDAFVGDADGNGYEDIFVLTDNNQIRVYLNKEGIFDVDGSVACLNQNVFDNQVSSTPSNLEGLHQLFVEDMDGDKNADIITYDKKGYIKVFFGGSNKNNEPNYLSKEKFSCDTGWYDREKGNMTTVTALGVKINGASVYDNSMMTWEGIGFVNEGMPFRKFIPEKLFPKYGIYFSPRDLVKLIRVRDKGMDGSIEAVTKEIMDKDKFNVTVATKRYIDEDAKMVEETLYENTLLGTDSKNYLFAPSSYLVPKKDTCSVWKNYRVKRGGDILMDGDTVTVTVTVQASILEPCNGAFGEIIQGPRNVYYDKNEIIMGDEGKVGVRPLDDRWRNAVVKKKDGNFAFLVDNITLAPGESMSFEYDLEYHQLPLKKMSITYDTFYGEGPDIKLQSVDGCDKNFMVFPGGSRSFSPITIPLQDMIDEEYKEGDKLSNDYAADVISYGSDANKLPGIIGNTIDRETLLRKKNSPDDAVTATDDVKNQLLKNILGGLDSLKMDLLIDLSIFEDQSEAIEEIVDELMEGMCNGFKFGSSNCKGLPVPFNQAFLAPGKYHLFGCWELDMGPLEGGIPMFFFPGTLRTSFGDLPIPWGLKSPSDGFLWPSLGSFDSFIRIYAAPTLTAQLGIAVCMGDYDKAIKIKSPASDLGGNCVVFAVQPKCSNGKKNSEKKEDRANPNPVYNKITEEVKNSGLCWQSQKGTMIIEAGQRSSPFDLCSFRGNYNKEKEKTKKDPFISARNRFNDNVEVGGDSYYPVDYSTSFLGIVELETTSFIGQDDDTSEKNNSIFVGDVDVLGGEYTVNKIKGGIQNGLRKLLIDKWLDPQIRYIANQLTKMHVNIKLPDLSNMIDREVQTLRGIGDKTSTIFAADDAEHRSSPMTKWSDISNETLENFGKSISNPFESLASLFNESNIINISTELITVKVPMVFKEDIDAYSLYLQQWLEQNQQIVDEWYEILKTLVDKCDDEPDPVACRQERNENLSSFIHFQESDWTKMQNQIYANLMILQEYRDFPFEIYERIHVVDRYVAEIAQLISDTIGYLGFWTSTNAERFVGYVDAIVLILNVIKTYQILIDFSIEWGEKCGSCSKDTYDQYTCKLSILCDGLQLPIIQIPNFKLPNITIDLTDIDLGLDIILPEFNFQPVKIDLPDLVNLPEPPSIGANIRLFDLPDIPLLPEPPELPELPSFIPEIELELPLLPPAPEVPEIPGSIEAMVKAADLIGKIMCIVKLKFGLVGESSVKAKIEQLTQRTYDVKWIDTIMDFTNWSVAPIHNYGLDYEISSSVDLQFNFTDFYNYLDALTKSINSLSTSSINWLNKETNSLVEENPILNTFESIDSQNVQLNFDLSLANTSGKNIEDIPGLLADEVKYVDYDSAKSRLKEVLAYFREEVRDTTFSDSLNAKFEKMENQINRKNKVSSNTKGLENLKNEVFNYLDQEKKKYNSLSDMINNDYEGFLAMVDSRSKESYQKSDSSTGLLAFNLKLFDVDSSTQETINNIRSSNPYEDLMDNKKSIIEGYWNAINSNTASNLGLSQSQYLVLRDGIGRIQNQIATLYRVTRPASSTELVAKNSNQTSSKTLLSFESRGARLGSNLEVSHAIDPAALSIGIYDKIQYGADEGKLTKIVYSDSFAKAIGEKYYRDNGNFVLWDKNTVYQKCAGQTCSDGGGGGGVYFSKDIVKEIPYKETLLPFAKDTELKIADEEEEVKNWKVYGQTYDTLSMSWRLGDADAYLIKLVERVDHSYEKADYEIKTPVRYVLALPEGVSLDDLYQKNTKLELLTKTKSLKDLYDSDGSDESKELRQIVYYNPHKLEGDAALSNVDRKWYFARIAALNYDEEKNIYNIDSPWSNQIVAGKQMVGDEQPPVGTAELVRTSIDKVVSQGDELEGYVSTNYRLDVKWRDNVALYYINVSKDGKTVEKYTNKDEDVVSIDVPIHTGEVSEIYNAVGIDQFGNKTEKVITINFLIPEITITDISKQDGGDTVYVNARLSQDLDQGNVSFQRRRGSAWKTMRLKDDAGDSDISLKPGMLDVPGNYSAGNEIAMYDKNGEVMALMDPDTAEIKIQSGYEDTYNVRVKVEDSPVLQVCNKEAQPKFSIVLPTEECLKIEADNYKISKLPEVGMMGRFNGGNVISKDGTNILYISPSCYLYSELGLQGDYSYDRGLGAVLVTLYQYTDSKKKNPIKIWMKVKPFLEN